jgi:hypothetical protein
LWNFEVVCYTDQTFEILPIANIGTGGKGIINVINYYQATATESKPTIQNGGETGSLWKSSISDAQPGPEVPYLWTYEETIYSSGGPEKTPVTLLSREPRIIESIIEYY